MNGNIIKSVDFLNDTLTSIYNTETGETFSVVREVCKNLGFDECLIMNQIRKVKSDSILSKGYSKMKYLTNGGPQEVSCLNIDYLPIWLVKINTKRIKDEKLKYKLTQYQLKAKDVLARAFIGTELMTDVDKIQLMKIFFVSSDDKLLSVSEFSKLTYSAFHMGRNQMFRYLRENKILMSGSSGKNLPYQEYINNGWFVVKYYVSPFPQSFITRKGQYKLCNKLIRRLIDNNDTYSMIQCK